ncbi:sugar kinase [[Clostridium] polysaccharolyticum]|jgi:2-dehydro-3-deoxygluconokinase|uniref:2-dehydro-3-deoxygluconokinase n=1 Tax=[Clostridium] polysaccharolyticum TaxID=29364 RepID=A0A1I0E6X0_9FIRM|nr:sugar kinase [[Clostridium] polysaccharolyticum]SET40898.1 2-dehydro-3-deoxygluconokinase [[Clostridium] polysaccharolyticum]
MKKNEKTYDILALGELLLKLSAPVNERLTRGNIFQKQVGGAEFNVIAGSSILGLHTGIISKIPAHDIGTIVRHEASSLGVSDEFLINDTSKEARLGIYYYENGAYPRKPNVIYDRLYSSINSLNIQDIPDKIYRSTKCFHTSGITLALCENVRNTAVEMIKRFKKNGALISFDVNFRANLWTGAQAKSCIEEILPYVDIFFCSEDTARLTFLKKGNAKEIMKSFTKDYPISVVASTQRIVHSPKSHTFGSIVYNAQTDTYYQEDPYRNIDVIDRIGSGDAYISGALYGLLSSDMDCKKAMEFGNAAASIKNTIPGDLLCTSFREISQIIEEHQSSGPQSEMNR